MTVRPTRGYLGIISAIIIAGVLVSASLYLALGGTTKTVTVGPSSLSTSSGRSEACTIGGEGFLLMRILNSSGGEPIGSLPVQVEAQYPACQTNPPRTDNLGTQNTNSSGFLSLSGPYNWYYLAFTFNSRSYSVNASINAGASTCVSIYVPSGSLNIIQQCDAAEYFSQQTSTSSSSSPAECAQSHGSSSGFPQVFTGTSSPGIICFQVYYYNSTSPLTINLGDAFSILASQYIANGSVSYPRTFSGAANFTVTPSQDELTIGGPNNENEGAVIGYAIAADPGASGTYLFRFPSSTGLSAYLISTGIPINCGQYGELVAGTGEPDYAQLLTTCITFTSATNTTSSGAGYHAIPGASFPLPDGNVYFLITGTTNSTQIAD